MIPMLIKPNFPPGFDAIDARFNIRNRGLTPIFAFAPDVWNPFGVAIGPELVAHEQVHIMRQGQDPAAWWKRYIAEDNFRLAEEVFAHIAEYENLIERGHPTRDDRRRAFRYITKRLCWPLYDYNPALSETKAKGILKWALKEKAKWGAAPFWNAVDKAKNITVQEPL
jgi:hypothetical protein